MSVANPTFQEPCHRPCPDMRHHSLTQEDKARGLHFLNRTRNELRDRALAPLREEYNQLSEQAECTNHLSELHAIHYRQRLLDKRMNKIEARWR